MIILENNIKKFINKLFNKSSENNFDKFLKQHCEKLESFDISIMKEYCHKNINNCESPRPKVRGFLVGFIY